MMRPITYAHRYQCFHIYPVKKKICTITRFSHAHVIHIGNINYSPILALQIIFYIPLSSIYFQYQNLHRQVTVMLYFHALAKGRI